MDRQRDLPLSGPVEPGVVVVNGRCTLRREARHCVVVVAGLAVHHYCTDDSVADAYATVFLVDGGFATVEEVAVAFEVSERTVRRRVERYGEGGMQALATRSGWRPGRRRLPAGRLRVVQRMKAKGLSNREIARRLGVTENAIRKQVGPSREPSPSQTTFLEDDGVEEAMEPVGTTESGPAPSPGSCGPTPLQAPCEGESGAEPGSMPMSLDVDPRDRFWDRLLACFGLACSGRV